MDIESDESERWEDFFGSSTDLTPSVIGYYDRLSTSIDSNSNYSNESFIVESSTDNSYSTNGSITTSTSSTSTTINSIDTQYTPASPLTTSTPANQKHRNFRILSQNVQRIISHSNSALDNIDKSSPAGNISLDNTPKSNQKRILGKHRHPPINIPLSRNTCKLAQAGNELVDTIESKENEEILDNVKTPTNVSDREDDANRTPTNNNNRSFLSDLKEKGIKGSDSAGNALRRYESVLEQKLLKSTKIRKIVERLQSVRSTTTNGDQLRKPNVEMSSDANGLESDSSDEHFEDCIAEATNLFPKVPFPNLQKENNVKDEEQLPEKSQVNVNENKCNGQNEPAKVSVENLNIKNSSKKSSSSPKSSKSRNFFVDEKDSGKLSSLSAADLARLKHRPLSASSICSTSSTSSSGSERMASKLGVSYLASVESLADHSENELSNSGLTVCERACLEMIDSEKSYVDDLGQVIKGYLTDWKEGACLRTDELKILFSNIEEVYDFNSVLLAELIESGLDPVKIAKCFIKLKDRFDVYTTYCTSYPEAISLLTSLLQASHTNALLASTQKLLRHTLPLGSYLLKPVQRILKYHLLLDNLRKHCDCIEVVQAHNIMREVARHIDQVKRNLEQLSRVKELSGILDGWLGPELTVLGDLKLEGLLMENNKPRIVLLFQTMLIITKKKEDKRLQFKTYIHCKHLMLIEHLPGEPTSFNVIPYDDPHPTQIKLTAKNRDEKREWAQHIKQVMLEHFDIPSRAKELVFKLGDEEDRTPDKNTWKWGANSSSQRPEYLERRNQYRRSEMRYRSKKQRKPLNASLSVDGFDKKVLPNASVDDANQLENGENSKKDVKPKNICGHNSETCNCKSVKEELTSRLNHKISFKGKDGRSRSKSEPRISDTFLNNQNHLGKESLVEMGSRYGTLSRSKPKLTEIKSYNTKTLPKRIVNLRKQKSKASKETFKFYMDLPDETTVLRITESSDNLTEAKIDQNNVEPDNEPHKEISTTDLNPSVDDQPTTPSPIAEEKNPLKRDVEIISDLLKANKEFEKILNKPPKKKSFDNGKFSSSHEDTPPPEQTSQELVEKLRQSEEEMRIQSENLISRLNSIQKSIKTPEPIYESLLRNVHVPYKYSPVLSRSISQQNYKFSKFSKAEEAESSESDYVTLVYTETGKFKCVLDDDSIPSMKDEVSLLRNSDSNINYNKISNISRRDDEENSSSISVVGLDRRGSFNLKSSMSMFQKFITSRYDEAVDQGNAENWMMSRMKKNGDNLNLKINRMSERRVSDVSEMCRQNFIHKQGSETLGSRIAHLDYEDPKMLFTATSQTNILINKNIVKPQRDSVFSLTSSNDSVNDSKQQNNAVLGIDSTTESYYEKSVEDSLENDGVFRDSAIYSDDNERRNENIYETPTTPVTPVTQTNPNNPPIPPPRNTPPKVPKKPVRSPPPLPAKLLTGTGPVENGILGKSSTNSVESTMKIMLTKEHSRSWVSQQIKNFEK